MSEVTKKNVVMCDIPDSSLIFVVTMETLGGKTPLRHEDVVAASDEIKRVFPEARVLIVPSTTNVRVVSSVGDGVYHREKVGDVELEVVAKTEDDLRDRFEWWWKSNKNPKP